MAKSEFVLYGANGYTGRLIIEEALSKKIRPVIAGRNADSIKALAKKYDLEYRVFSLDNVDDIVENIEDAKVLLLAAGPFSATSKIAVDACLKAKTHYTDITGEISVFEACKSRHDEALKAGIMILPGIGFDVVPSDCLAASLHKSMPDAEYLTLGIAAIGKPSPGTMKTMLEGFNDGGLIRSDGRLTKVSSAWKTTKIHFKDVKKLAMTIPWGDVSTAYTSTGIPNIAVYMALPEPLIHLSGLTKSFSGVLGLKPIQNVLKQLIEKNVKGPTEEERKNGKSLLWGRVENSKDEFIEGNMQTLEGYDFTAKSGADIISRILKDQFKTGYATPSLAYGADYVESIAGTTVDIGSKQKV